MQARRLAVEAAKEKAAVYAEAAGVVLGSVIHIEDVDPQRLQARSQFHVGGLGQLPRDPMEHDAAKESLDPKAIEVAAAVLLAFSLQR
jgi:uncharacterized protein YggE